MDKEAEYVEWTIVCRAAQPWSRGKRDRRESVVIGRQVLEHLDDVARQLEQGERSGELFTNDIAAQLYSGSYLEPVEYCYVAIITELLRNAAHNHWDRIAIGQIMRRCIDREVPRFILAVLDEEDLGKPIQGSAEPTEFALALRAITESIAAYISVYGERNSLRKTIRWSYEQYRPYVKKLLNDSTSNICWLMHMAELVPRLLLKNIFAIDNTVQMAGPQVTLGPDYGYFQTGAVTRTASLYRTLFGDDEIADLRAEGQRISEVFAHVGAILFSEPLGGLDLVNAEIGKTRQQFESRLSSIEVDQVLGMSKLFNEYDARRLDTRLSLEQQFRRHLAIPTHLYNLIREMFDLTDRGGSNADAVILFFSVWGDKVPYGDSDSEG